MHRVGFEWKREELGASEETVNVPVILVDGRSLSELVGEVERLPASAEGSPSLAGNYAGLAPWAFEGDGARSVSAHYLGGEGSHLHAGPRKKTVLLGCPCGEAGCWPLMARVEVTPDEVVWDEFEQPHREGWSYEALGPLHFAREQYETALRELEWAATG